MVARAGAAVVLLVFVVVRCSSPPLLRAFPVARPCLAVLASCLLPLATPLLVILLDSGGWAERGVACLLCGWWWFLASKQNPGAHQRTYQHEWCWVPPYYYCY